MNLKFIIIYIAISKERANKFHNTNILLYGMEFWNLKI